LESAGIGGGLGEEMVVETAQSLNIHRLYHYQSFERPERLAQIFTDRKLYFSALEHLNDPWDCRPYFRTSGLDAPAERDRVIRWMIDAARKHNPSLPDSNAVAERKSYAAIGPFWSRWLTKILSKRMRVSRGSIVFIV
jgi:hypothetical protein